MANIDIYSITNDCNAIIVFEVIINIVFLGCVCKDCKKYQVIDIFFPVIGLLIKRARAGS